MTGNQEVLEREINNKNKVFDFRIYKYNNNLDHLDNLDQIPEEKAVYAICARINGKPSHCRFVGQTENLQRSIKVHFDLEEPDDCLKTFMQSIKIKTINYELLPDSTEAERLMVMQEWEMEFAPECNASLNEVF